MQRLIDQQLIGTETPYTNLLFMLSRWHDWRPYLCSTEYQKNFRHLALKIGWIKSLIPN